jgi:hypothetical protein
VDVRLGHQNGGDCTPSFLFTTQTYRAAGRRSPLRGRAIERVAADAVAWIRRHADIGRRHALPSRAASSYPSFCRPSRVFF